MSEFLRKTETIVCAILIMITIGVAASSFVKAPVAVGIILGQFGLYYFLTKCIDDNN